MGERCARRTTQQHDDLTIGEAAGRGSLKSGFASRAETWLPITSAKRNNGVDMDGSISARSVAVRRSASLQHHVDNTIETSANTTTRS